MMTTSPHRGRTLRLAAALASALAIGLTGLLATPAQAALPGQTTTVSGVLRNTAGVGVAGVTMSYNNYNKCSSGGRVDLTSPDDSGTVTTAANGSFTFPAFPSQCYVVSAGSGLIRYQGEVQSSIFVTSGTTGIVLTQLPPQTITISAPGVPNGTSFSLTVKVKFGGVYLWYPSGSGTFNAGSATVTGYAGTLQSVVIARSGDYYMQYEGGALSAPSLSGGAGTFTTSATASSASHTATFKKSSPVHVTLSNVAVGASVSATGFGSFSQVGTTTTETTTTATGITLHGLTPGQQQITVSGTSGGSPVSAESFGVTVTTSGSTINTSLTAGAQGTDLSSAADPTLAVTGSYRVGEKLTATTTLQSTAAPYLTTPGTVVRYYWYGGSLGLTGAPTPLVGTGATFTIPPGMTDYDVLFVEVVVSAPGQKSSSIGESLAYIRASLLEVIGSSSQYPTDEIALGSTPLPSVLPSISGTARVGSTLTAQPGKWSPAPTSFGYQWARNGKAIAGATAKTYKPTAADAGAKITVTVSPRLAGHAVRSMTTGATAKVGKAKATVSAKLSKRSAKAGTSVKVTVRVKATGATPTGKVTVKYGSKKATGKLKNGKATVTLKKLKKGTYKVTVSYTGSTSVAKATAKKQTLRVK